MNLLRYGSTELAVPPTHPDGLPERLAPIPTVQALGTHALATEQLTSAEVARYDLFEALHDPNERCDRLAETNESHQIWRTWGMMVANNPGIPLVLKHYGVIGAEGSENWRQLLDHTMAVAGAAYTLGAMLQKRGVAVDMDTVMIAAATHDAAKRQDLARRNEHKLQAGMENDVSIADTSLFTVLEAMGYNQKTIVAAENTGRKDRYFATAEERRASIRAKGVEAAIVGYTDARTLDARFKSLEQGQQYYLERKVDPTSQDFFLNHWLPYYKDVEAYFAELADNLDVATIDDKLIEQAISESFAAGNITDQMVEDTVVRVVTTPQYPHSVT